MKFENKRLNLSGLFFWLLAAGGIFLRYRALDLRSLWIDEIEQLTAVNLPFWRLLTYYVPKIPGGFPGDYIITWPMAQFTQNKWLLAMPHYGTMVAGFLLFYIICRREEFRFWPMILAGALYSFNSNLIFHALELRPYASTPTMALLLYAAAGYMISKPLWTLQMNVAWAALLFIGILFHAYGIVMVGCIVGYHFLFSREGLSEKDTFKKLFLPTLTALVLAAPIWWFFARISMSLKFGYSPYDFCGHTPVQIIKFVLATLGDLNIPKGWFLATLIVFLGFVPTKGRLQRLIFLLFIVVLPIGAIFISDVRNQYWFIQRQFIWIMPLWAILAGQSLQALLNWFSSRKMTPAVSG